MQSSGVMCAASLCLAPARWEQRTQWGWLCVCDRHRDAPEVLDSLERWREPGASRLWERMRSQGRNRRERRGCFPNRLGN